MKRTLAFLGAIVTVISLSATMTVAKSTYQAAVKNTCGTLYDCSYCHDNPTSKQGYLDDGACYFCPTADSCTAPPPQPLCTDADKDGYFKEPGCAQLYDCNDGNSTIYPGAPEIGCDGIDQDCSGADKLKGRGCRNRK